MRSIQNILFALPLFALACNASRSSDCRCIKSINNSTIHYEVNSSYCTDEQNRKPFTSNQISLYGELPEDENEYEDIRYPELNLCSERVPPKCFYSLKNVDALTIMGDATKLESIKSMKNLKILNIYKTDISGPIPSYVGKLNNLEYIDLYGNSEISGKFINTIKNLPKLKRLEINFGRKIVDKISKVVNLKNLENLIIKDTGIYGSIPENISNLKKLEEIVVIDNKLSGEIPDSIGKLNKLFKIALSGNKLTGTIPESIGNLKNLKYIYFDNNKLTGEIPETLENLSELDALYLNNNNLSGQIPKSLNKLPNLESVDFSNNPKLYGLVVDSENINSCNYENTQVCYKTGKEKCITGAKKCTKKQLKKIAQE